jgi:hypothetical protein
MGFYEQSDRQIRSQRRQDRRHLDFAVHTDEELTNSLLPAYIDTANLLERMERDARLNHWRFTAFHWQPVHSTYQMPLRPRITHPWASGGFLVWRFGVECFYRLLRQVKVLTNSRNPVLRFLGLVMQNFWVHLRWLCTPLPSKGRHKLIPTLLR